MAKQTQDLQARYSASGNAIIPNTFQHPNIFVDRLMHYLSPSENIVLTFAVRRILGFQSNIISRKDNISISQFTDGIKADDGRPLSMGCGLGTQAVINALESLAKFKILLPTTLKPNPHKGQEYWLQENESAIDWDGLEERKNSKKDKFKRQTKKARRSVEQKGSVEQNDNHSVEQNDNALLNRNTKPTETHQKPSKKRAAAPQPAEIVLFREIVRHYPRTSQRDLVIDAIQKISARLGRECSAADLQPFWTAWAKVSGNEWSLVWLTEWAVSGVIPNGRQNQQNVKAHAREENIGNVLTGWLAEREVVYGN